MSNKSGVSEQIISLPEGGGALSGLGEKFSPDLFTGTGNFTVPIDLPAGRNDFQPELTLTYSTGNGNGPFGLGWQLSIPGVSRKTSEGIPVYDDSEDTFVLSGAEDLVPVEAEADTPADAERRITYRPRTEGLFSRIVSHQSPTSDYWTVRSKDGLVSTYGTPETRREDPATVADPANPEKVFAWRLTRTEDPFGNQIGYEYLSDSGNEPQHHWDHPLIERIRYVDYEDETETNHLVTVTFEYEDRPDPFSEYRSGFEIRTTKRCTRILVRTNAGEKQLVRSYDFTYLDERENRAGRLPLNGSSLLGQVTVTGHDSNETEQLPPLTFEYTTFDPEERDFFPLDGDLPSRSLADPDTELVDLFGNGLPDIIQMNDTVRYWRNVGNGRFEEPRKMRTAPAGLRLADQGVQLIDANGDGRTDLLSTTSGMAGYFPLEFDGTWDSDSFRRYENAPSFDLEDPAVQLVDLDGDGVTDALRSGSRFECFFNDPETGWDETRTVARDQLDTFPNVNFSDRRVRWADCSGDGLQDIVLVHDGNVEYWPNLGHGKWGDRIYMPNSPRFPHGYDPRRLLFGDIDGDGLADLVYVEDNRVLLWINQSGNRWSDPMEIDGTPSVSDMDAVRLVDLLGTGVKGLLWSADDRGVGDQAFFLDFTGGTKPYLLDEMDNHMGAITRVAYTPSTEFYLEDEKRPKTRWETSLPFPVQVVSRVESIDAISEGKLTTEYRYHHGYWDGAEREFRGFGMVEQLDSETFDDYNSTGLHGEERRFADVGRVDGEQFSPPTVTKTWFHQGPVGDEFGDWREPDYSHEYWPEDPQVLSRPDAMQEMLRNLPHRARRDALRTLRGRVMRKELYALDGSDRENRPYTVTEQRHGVREENSPSDGERRRIFFPHSLGTRTTQWERGADPKTRVSFAGEYDDYGQPQSEIRIAVPRNRDFRQPMGEEVDTDPYLATCTVTDYAQRDDETTYIVDRVARTTTYEVENDGRDELFELKREIERAIERQTFRDTDIIGQTVNFYDGEAFRGEEFGTLGEHGALVRTERLALTDDVLRDVHQHEGIASIPPYLTMDAGAEWEDYPAEFRAEYAREFVEGLPVTESIDLTRPGLRITPAGYGVPDGEEGAAYASGYFVASERRAYDFQTDPDREGKGLTTVQRDELGRDTTITYDEFDLLPTTVEDPAGLVTTARYDYRVFEPAEVTDPNENRTAHAFTPLGLPERIAVMGQEDEEKGDTLDQPGTHFTYDFAAFDERGEPVSVETIQREVHRWALLDENPEADPAELFPADELGRFPERFIRSREYSDGFGRVVQTRTQAEDVVFGDSAFGNDELLIDQAVLVRDGEPDGFRPETLEELTGHTIGVATGTTGARLIRKLVTKSEGLNSTIEQNRTARAAVRALEDGVIDAVIVDESVAIEFAKRRTVEIALTTGPGEVVGRELSSSDRPRVVVSGWQTYDNKGQVVEQYEPFFDRGFEFLARSDAANDEQVDRFGRKTTLYYDPRGEVVRTVNPDGSEEQVVYGVPVELDDPDTFQPTPWEAYTYDTNDNAGRSHEAVSDIGSHLKPPEDYEHHWNTPSNEVVDALGRTVEATARTRDDPRNSPEEHHTRSSYDIRGNLLTVTDALDREAFRYTCDLRDETLRTESIDAGTQITVLDAAGSELERRDSKGALVLQAYDELTRPLRLWARDADGEPLTLRERLVYGDAAAVDGADRNLLGELYQHYDEAGLLTVERYDFKGNVVEKRRQVLGDDTILEETPVDWRPSDGTTLSAHADALLERADADSRDDAPGGDGYRTTYTYDALDRTVAMRYPEDVEGDRQELRPSYNRAGALEAVELVSHPDTDAEHVESYVEHVAYNAKGQRTCIAYGNGVMTRYAYDPETFRLVRLRTDEYTNPEAFTYRPNGTVLQDYSYEYDLAGNVTTIRDRTPDSGIIDSPLGRHALDQEFEYDPLYRLVSATGRECGSMANRKPWDGRPRCADLTETRPYSEQYRYDPVGNLTELRHASGERERDAADDGQFTRLFSLESESNRLEAMTVGETGYDYAYDDSGNLLRETARRHFDWDHSDRLRAFRTRAGEGEPSLHAHYLYDGAGQRVKKLVEKDGERLESTVYVDGIYEHHRIIHGDETRENNTLHVMDDERRIATVRIGEPIDGDRNPAVQYQLSDHLQACTVVVDRAGSPVNREAYTPYGETSFGSFSKKRYRYAGKERDGENGFYYYGSRYYSPWSCRWTNTDPAGPVDSHNLYEFARNNPMRFVDPDGRQAADSNGSAETQQEPSVHANTDKTPPNSCVCQGGHHKSGSSSRTPGEEIPQASFSEIAEYFQETQGGSSQSTGANTRGSAAGDSSDSTGGTSSTFSLVNSLFGTVGQVMEKSQKAPGLLREASNKLARRGTRVADAASTNAASKSIKMGKFLEDPNVSRGISRVKGIAKAVTAPLKIFDIGQSVERVLTTPSRNRGKALTEEVGRHAGTSFGMAAGSLIGGGLMALVSSNPITIGAGAITWGTVGALGGGDIGRSVAGESYEAAAEASNTVIDWFAEPYREHVRGKVQRGVPQHQAEVESWREFFGVPSIPNF